MSLSFTKCALNNLDTLASLSKSTFVDAFAANNNPEDFKNYIDSAFSKEQIKKELLNPNSSFNFVYNEKQLVGYFKLNINDAQNEIYSQKSIELERIYVLPEFQNNGLGKLFLNEIIKLSKGQKVAFLWLGVWTENKNAIRFYERLGFKPFDTHSFYIGKDKQTDLLMKLELE